MSSSETRDPRKKSVKLGYKEYFTPIAVQQMTKSSRDIQDLVDMKSRIFGQAVSKYMIVSVCVML
jgi:hypothetical protein